MKRLTRRGFLRMMGLAGLAWSAAGCGTAPEPTKPATGLPSPTAVPKVEVALPSPSPSKAASPLPPPTVQVRLTPSPGPSPTAIREEPRATPSIAPTKPPATVRRPAELAIMRGPNAEAITRAAIAALGGMERFVKQGNRVVVKPNICVSHQTPEYAATTNPQVMSALVRMCLEAGAKEVRAMDAPFSGTARIAYDRSGIQQAVQQAGGRMELMAEMKYQEVPIPQGRDLKSWVVYQDALEVDVLIDVPIAKHHNMARLTLGMKNLMGVIQDRPKIHWNMGQRIADITSLVKPDLTVVDAVRILMDNGPTGGRLEDVRRTDTVIASPDIVAADSCATTLFGLKGQDIDYVRIGHEMGLGEIDWRKLAVIEESIV